jgi:hypothetical protein
LGVSRSAMCKPTPEPYIINSPFLVQIYRQGLELPLFTAYVDTDAWKEH